MTFLVIALTTVAMAPVANASIPTPPVGTFESLVISEVAPDGPGGPEDEYLELRNSGDQPVDIGGWRLSACGTVSPPTLVTTFPGGTTMSPQDRPGQYLLLAGTEYQGRAEHPGPQTPDLWIDLGMSASGGWLLSDRLNRPVAGVGSGAGCADNPRIPACDWRGDEAAVRQPAVDPDVRAGYSCRSATPTNSSG